MRKLKAHDLLLFFGNDSKEEIAEYMANNIQFWRDNPEHMELFISDMIDESDKATKRDMTRLEIMSYITDHFAIEEREVREPDEQNDEEEWQVKIGCSFVSIEVTTKGSATMRDNGNDIYHSLGGSKKYYWRWL
jgi:hypothetical protein